MIMILPVRLRHPGASASIPRAVVRSQPSSTLGISAFFGSYGKLRISPSSIRADPKKQVPDNRLSVIDLKANPPAVIATLEAGPGAAGTAINRAGTLALVANYREGTLSGSDRGGGGKMGARATQLRRGGDVCSADRQG